MTTNNKILTVSYGTFSCTLEGFEDNFGTMKAIAEYFRDLAADDRYFGAEPPQPDAEMLSRIAEREISRRVEAREHEGRIFLSAAENADAAAPVAAAAVVAAQTATGATADVLASEPDDQTGDAPLAHETIEASVMDSDVVDGPEGEDVAEAAIETEATVDEAATSIESGDDDVASAVDAIVDETIVDETPAEDTPPEATDDAVETEVTETEVTASAQDAVAQEEAQIDAFFTDSIEYSEDDAEGAAPAEQPAATAEPVAPETPAAPAADSIAAKLQRIRAVVSQSQQNVPEDELFEDEHAYDAMRETDVPADVEEITDTEQTAEDVAAQAAQDIEEALEIDDAAEVADIEAAEGADIDEDTSAEDGDELSALMARLETDAPAPQVAAPSEPAVAADEDMGLDTLAALMAADHEPDDASGTAENLFESTEAADPIADESDAQEFEADLEDAVAAESDEGAAADATEAEAQQAEAQPPVRARVLKVKRADIDAALASGQLEQVEDEDDADDETAETTLSADEEAELQAELARVEAELPTQGTTAQDTTETAQDEIVETVQPARPAPAKPQDLQDNDVSRLMAEAENQMEEPEGSNRRDAFAHLKAAVKAKKADAEIGNDSIKDEGAFRSDLAEVVKPRRPEVTAARDERPETARPAPLKLVAAQRVDVDSAPKGPVRPRRVAATQEVTPETSGADSFADYAAEQGAHDLPALLEAAASYLSFVEGQDQFSRPQLMTKVRQIEQNDFSREDSLRSFGQLLRAGKIEKIAGGRFAVTGDIGYRPENRAAG